MEWGGEGNGKVDEGGNLKLDESNGELYEGVNGNEDEGGSGKVDERSDGKVDEGGNGIVEAKLAPMVEKYDPEISSWSFELIFWLTLNLLNEPDWNLAVVFFSLKLLHEKVLKLVFLAT